MVRRESVAVNNGGKGTVSGKKPVKPYGMVRKTEGFCRRSGVDKEQKEPRKKGKAADG